MKFGRYVKSCRSGTHINENFDFDMILLKKMTELMKVEYPQADLQLKCESRAGSHQRLDFRYSLIFLISVFRLDDEDWLCDVISYHHQYTNTYFTFVCHLTTVATVHSTIDAQTALFGSEAISDS